MREIGWIAVTSLIELNVRIVDIFPSALLTVVLTYVIIGSWGTAISASSTACAVDLQEENDVAANKKAAPKINDFKKISFLIELFSAKCYSLFMKSFLAKDLARDAKANGNIKIMGRAAFGGDGIDFFWTASGFELNAKAGELWAQIESDYERLEVWISVWVDGVQFSRLMLNKGSNNICLFRNLNPQNTKNVRVYKETQAMGDDSLHRFLLKSLSTDGDLLPVTPQPLKIEFIGDSITSGEGAIGAKGETDWTSLFFGGTKTWAFKLASAVNADFNVISQSGWGVVSGYDCNLDHAIPKHYEEICSVMKRPKANEKWDFGRFEPDWVIVNLGTNDQGPCQSRPDISEIFEAGVVSFLKNIRLHNPKAKIVWCYGMIGHILAERLQKAVDAYKAQSGDKDVQYILLPEIDMEKTGALSHPTEIQQQEAAEYLRSQIVGL